MLAIAFSVLFAVQAAPPSDTDEILVVGQPLTRETARRYVNEVTRPVNGQLPTFRHPVCPEVIGMSADHAGIVAERIRKVAKHVDVDVDRPGCAPNLRIVIVDNPQQFVAELKQQKPQFFGGMTIGDIDRLIADTGPALAWNGVQVQNEDGQIFADNGPGKSSFDNMHKNRVGSGGPGSDEMLRGAEDMSRGGSGAPAMRTKSASIIKSTTRQSILGSYVVIGTEAAKNKSLMQLADYAAMRALGGAQPPEKDIVVETILTLFDEDKETPLSIRAPDVAYLKGLYSGSPTMNSSQQLNRITKAVLKTSPQTTDQE